MNLPPQYPLQGWIPYHLLETGTSPSARWLYTGDVPFNQPFFDETISHCRQLRQNHPLLRSVSSIEVLPEWAAAVDAVPAAAVIFHVSRCGSTLLSQLLALQPQHTVLSEVPFFDQLLRHLRNTGASETDTLQLLRAAINLYADRRTGAEEKLFIKTDSWHIFFYPLLRKLYPQVPFILLYRHPAEVVRSQQKKRGMQAIPGLIEADLFGFDAAAVVHQPLDEYMAAVLEKYFDAFISIVKQDPLAIPLDYRQGSLAMMQQLAKVAQLQLDEAGWQTIAARAGSHAKFPGQPFTAEPPVAAVPAYLSPATALYHQLEHLRLERASGYIDK